MEESKKDIIVSGVRPTGRMHLGNYWGSLKNWVDLQNKYECYFFVANWHALTTGADKSSKLAENTREMVLDWLAVGLDPEKCVFFRQSDVKQHAELSLLLSMVTPISWLLRNPTFKDQLNELYRQKYKGQEDKMKKAEGVVRQLAETSGQDADGLALNSDMAVLGFLGYPVLMAADILLYDAKYVPVGRDQLPHLELARDMARRFNKTFGREVLREPQPLFTKVPVVPGLDGRKMSKSYNNTLSLGEESSSLRKKINGMFTDPLRVRADDPGHPDGCVVCAFHRIYNPAAASNEENCRAGKISCGDCKKCLFELMDFEMSAFRARRAELEKTADVEKLLTEGAEKAVRRASRKMLKVSKAAGLI